MKERDGQLVPAHYHDARAEYDAVRGGASAGVIDLSSRGRVEVSGAEAVQFLNGMITNDAGRLADGAWMHAAFPNVQGRLLATARVARRGDTFLIDTEAATSERVRQSLERFTLAGDFRVRDVSKETALLSVQGAGASRVLTAVLGEETAGMERGRASDARRGELSAFVLRATHTSENGFDLLCDAERAERLWDALISAGARPVGFDALELLRVEAGVVRYGVDADDANVVLEAVSDEAVSFTKGCYVGQEIIARIHWRGHVAKKLAGLIVEAEDVLPPGAKVFANDAEREAGRVTSCVFSPRLGKTVALAVLKYDYLKPGTEVRVVVAEDAGPRAARVVELPFVRGSWYAEEASAGSEG